MKTNKIFINFIFILIFSSLVTAAPGIPHQFFGSVKVNNAPANDNLAITVKINDNVVASTTTSNGKYGYNPIFYVEDPNNDRSGRTVTFFVAGIQAGTATFTSGASTELNLAITVSNACKDNDNDGFFAKEPLCSEGTDCNDAHGGINPDVNEICDNLDNNCNNIIDEGSICQGGSTGGGGAGGGGGSGGSGGGSSGGSTPNNILTQTTCMEDWKCDDWGTCSSSGLRFRSCVDNNKCGTFVNQPKEVEPCNFSLEAEQTEESEEEQEEVQQGFFSRLLGIFGITGATVVPNAINNKAIGISIIFLIVILFLIIYFVFIKKKNNS